MEMKCCIGMDNAVEIPDMFMDDLNWKKGDKLNIKIDKNNVIVISKI